MCDVVLIETWRVLQAVLLARKVGIGGHIVLLLELDDEFSGGACCFFDRHFRWDFKISWEKLCRCR